MTDLNGWSSNAVAQILPESDTQKNKGHKNCFGMMLSFLPGMILWLRLITTCGLQQILFHVTHEWKAACRHWLFHILAEIFHRLHPRPPSWRPLSFQHSKLYLSSSHMRDPQTLIHNTFHLTLRILTTFTPVPHLNPQLQNANPTGWRFSVCVHPFSLYHLTAIWAHKSILAI